MSKLFEITIGLTPSEDECAFVDECDLEDVLARALPLTPGIRRGDVVWLEEFGDYRNEGKLIYNGEKLIPFADVEDEYGHLPAEFTINEFGVHHFRDVVAHNRLVWARFDNYSIEGEIIKAQLGSTVYTIQPYEGGIDEEFTPALAHQIMAYGAFEYTDDPLVLEYLYTGARSNNDEELLEHV
jgi:hypothetical protein